MYKTCFQGNICHFAIYYTALEEDRIAERFAGTALPELAADMLRFPPSASRKAQILKSPIFSGPYTTYPRALTFQNGKAAARRDLLGKGRRDLLGKGQSVKQSQASSSTSINEQQLVARSVISARLHQPRVWGRSGVCMYVCMCRTYIHTYTHIQPRVWGYVSPCVGMGVGSFRCRCA